MSMYVWLCVSRKRQINKEKECVCKTKRVNVWWHLSVSVHGHLWQREREKKKRWRREGKLGKRITKSKERRVRLHDGGTGETWEEGMCPTKSHLTQIDCSPLCQSQLSEQTTTLMIVYLWVCVWASPSPLWQCARCLLQNLLLCFLCYTLSAI